jgi:serine/threonine protein kinase
MQGLKNKYATLGKYILVKTLGSGYNSKVKLGYDAGSNQYFAVKIIKHSHPSLNLKTLKKEIEILSALKHENIVNLMEFQENADYVKKNGHSYKAVAIIMELVPGGELFEYVADSGRFSEETARTYFRILIETLEYCHNQGIAHRDLKPENLLFDANFNLKIADFGFATLLAGKDGSGQLHTILGTESYMAPEIHLRKPYSGPSVDLFACGIILFILLSGTPPFAKADPKSDPHYKLLCASRQDVFWKAHERNKPKLPGQENFYNEGFRDLMNSMLAVDPNHRLTIDQIKAHPWYNGDLADITALKAEFMQRKKMVDAELARQREAKQKQKLMAKMQTTHAPGAFGGIKPFRSLETEMENSLSKELEAKVNFETKREMQEYQSQAGFKAYTEIFTVMSPDFIFKLLCSSCQGCLTDFSVSEDTYKIKGKAARDEGNCNLNIVLTKVDDNTTCIEFHKRSGNLMTFYKVIDEIKKKLPALEVADDKIEEKAPEEKVPEENATEAQ